MQGAGAWPSCFPLMAQWALGHMVPCLQLGARKLLPGKRVAANHLKTRPLGQVTLI